MDNNYLFFKKRERQGKKIYIGLMIIFISLLSINLISANVSDLGYFSPNSCVQILQTCDACTYNNISSIMVSNGGGTPTLNTYTPNLQLTTTDNYTYNYSFCGTQQLGNYFINGIGNDGGSQSSWTYQFEIGLPLWILIVIMVFGYGIAILGFFKYRNEYISIAGGMVMLILGIYLVSYGIAIYNNTLTLVVGYITIALGAVAALVPIGEKLEVDMNFFDNR